MNRLTDRSKEIPLPCAENASFWARVHEKLARYEDSGLEPEQCAKYAQAEKEGRLLVLPCKAGDMVYFRRGRDIIGDTVERIVLDGMNQVFVGAHKVFIFRDFGKTVFLTREDAEKAMEGGLKMTNSQKIRAMTDEELAKHLFSITKYECPPGKKFAIAFCGKFPHCKKCWFDWLKQEVKDNG